MSARYIIICEGMPLYVGYCYKVGFKDMGWLGSGIRYTATTMRLKTANKIKYSLIIRGRGCYTQRNIVIMKLDDTTELGREILKYRNKQLLKLAQGKSKNVNKKNNE